MGWLRQFKQLEGTGFAPLYHVGRRSYWRLQQAVWPYQAASIERQLRSIAWSGRPVLVGPWLGEVAFEVQYWIPFLRWVVERFDLQPERVFVVSRGGVRSWYQGISRGYLDILDYLTPEEFRQRDLRRQELVGTSKQFLLTAFDRELLTLAKKELHIESAAVLHPRLMYALFFPYWWGWTSIKHVLEHTRFSLLSPPEALKGSIPSKYVAVKFYWSATFPKTEENRAFVARLIQGLAEHVSVVMLEKGMSLDDHEDYLVEGISNVYSTKTLVSPSTNLHIQSQVISHAQAFIGTHGGIAYLAGFYGIPTVCYYSNYLASLGPHLRVVHEAFEKINTGPFVILRPEHYQALQNVLGPERGRM